MDPGQLVKTLRELSPGFLNDVDLTPYQFTTSNFRRSSIPDLCEDFSTHGELTNSEQQLVQDRQKYLWEILSSDDQSRIRDLADTMDITDEEMEDFLAIMNRLANETEITKAEIFAPMLVEPEYSIWDTFKKKNRDTLPKMHTKLTERYDSDLNRRVNRVVIARQFPEQVGTLKLDLVPLVIWEDTEVKPQSLTATEPFMIWIKAGVVSGLILASPFVFVQLWSFVAAGLYGHERKYVYLYMPISMLLFFAGIGLAFFFVFEPVLDFLFTFNAQMGIEPIPRVNDWLSFVMFLPLGFGLAFQLPLLMLFFNRIGVFEIEAYLSKWRVAIMVIFFLSMLLTPADPISMILLAVPLTLLYFAGIAMCKWMPQGRNPYGSDNQRPPRGTPATIPPVQSSDDAGN